MIMTSQTQTSDLFYFMRSRRPAEEPVYHCNCPQCSRRFRYGPKQVDHKVQCPKCRKQFTLPPAK